LKLNKIECLTCGTVSTSREAFIDFSLSFPPEVPGQSLSVEDLIAASFQEEALEGEDNSYYCSACETKVAKAIKTHCMEKLPPYLILTMNRFFFDRVTLSRRKVLTPVAVPPVLSFEKSTYSLQSVIIHAVSPTRSIDFAIGHLGQLRALLHNSLGGRDMAYLQRLTRDRDQGHQLP